MTSIAEIFGYLVIVGIMFLPVIYLVSYFFYAAVKWRRTLGSWTVPEARSHLPEPSVKTEHSGIDDLKAS